MPKSVAKLRFCLDTCDRSPVTSFRRSISYQRSFRRTFTKKNKSTNIQRNGWPVLIHCFVTYADVQKTMHYMNNKKLRLRKHWCDNWDGLFCQSLPACDLICFGCHKWLRFMVFFLSTIGGHRHHMSHGIMCFQAIGELAAILQREKLRTENNKNAYGWQNF